MNPDKVPSNPVLKLAVNGQEFEMNRMNAVLYTHLGHYAIYDHAYVDTTNYTDGEAEASGFYLFRGNKAFGEVSKFMLKKSFPVHGNMLRPAERDVAAWERSFYADLRTSDSFPAEWDTTPEVTPGVAPEVIPEVPTSTD